MLPGCCRSAMGTFLSRMPHATLFSAAGAFITVTLQTGQFTPGSPVSILRTQQPGDARCDPRRRDSQGQNMPTGSTWGHSRFQAARPEPVCTNPRNVAFGNAATISCRLRMRNLDLAVLKDFASANGWYCSSTAPATSSITRISAIRQPISALRPRLHDHQHLGTTCRDRRPPGPSTHVAIEFELVGRLWNAEAGPGDP